MSTGDINSAITHRLVQLEFEALGGRPTQTQIQGIHDAVSRLTGGMGAATASTQKFNASIGSLSSKATVLVSGLGRLAGLVLSMVSRQLTSSIDHS
jgi:X-X-X-Leu-X-X-Gly heptad repeat protein